MIEEWEWGGGNKTSEIIGPKTYTSLTLQQLQQHKKGTDIANI